MSSSDSETKVLMGGRFAGLGNDIKLWQPDGAECDCSDYNCEGEVISEIEGTGADPQHHSHYDEKSNTIMFVGGGEYVNAFVQVGPCHVCKRQDKVLGFNNGEQGGQLCQNCINFLFEKCLPRA